jgi:hypothetical protein
MSGLEIGALALAAVWLAVLTVVVLASVRQIALLDLRVELGSPNRAASDGPEIGSDLPESAAAALSTVNGDGPSYLLFVSPTCAPCVEIASQLHHREMPRPVYALFSGDDRMASDFDAMFPPHIETLRDPIASDVAQALNINVTPFALQVENHVITGRAHLRSADDLVQLIEAYAVSDAAELAQRRFDGDC